MMPDAFSPLSSALSRDAGSILGVLLCVFIPRSCAATSVNKRQRIYRPKVLRQGEADLFVMAAPIYV
jgi:hypothetical protein